MVCIGGSIGKAMISDKRLAFNQQINCIRPIQLLSSYLYISVSTKVFYLSVLQKASGSATPIINRSKWEELLIPLCPIEEQKRIVNKATQLLKLCDSLKQNLKTQQTTANRLADTVVNL